jgi:hypothetical protein
LHEAVAALGNPQGVWVASPRLTALMCKCRDATDHAIEAVASRTSLVLFVFDVTRGLWVPVHVHRASATRGVDIAVDVHLTTSALAVEPAANFCSENFLVAVEKLCADWCVDGTPFSVNVTASEEDRYALDGGGVEFASAVAAVAVAKHLLGGSSLPRLGPLRAEVLDDSALFRGLGAKAAAMAHVLDDTYQLREDVLRVMAPRGFLGPDYDVRRERHPDATLFSFVDTLTGSTIYGCGRVLARSIGTASLAEVLDTAFPVKPYVVLRVEVDAEAIGSDEDARLLIDGYIAQVRRDVAAVLSTRFTLRKATSPSDVALVQHAVSEDDVDVRATWNDATDGLKIVEIHAVVNVVHREPEGLDGPVMFATHALAPRAAADDDTSAATLALHLQEAQESERLPPVPRVRDSVIPVAALSEAVRALHDRQRDEGGRQRALLEAHPLRYQGTVDLAVYAIDAELPQPRGYLCRQWVSHNVAPDLSFSGDVWLLVSKKPPRGTVAGSVAVGHDLVKASRIFAETMVTVGYTGTTHAPGIEAINVALQAAPAAGWSSRGAFRGSLAVAELVGDGCLVGTASCNGGTGWATLDLGLLVVGCTTCRQTRAMASPPEPRGAWERACELRFSMEFVSKLCRTGIGLLDPNHPEGAEVVLPTTGETVFADEKWHSVTSASSSRHRVAIVKSTTGTGKTRLCLDTLERMQSEMRESGKELRVLVITHRVALAHDLARRFEPSNIDMANYLEAKEKLDPEDPSVREDAPAVLCARREDVLGSSRVICGFDSLMLLLAANHLRLPRYDVVVLDEIDSFLRHVSETPGRGQRHNVELFTSILEATPLVLGLDADAGDRTYHFLRNALPNVKPTIFWNTYRNDPLTFEVCADEKRWVASIMAAAEEAERVHEEDPDAPRKVIVVCGARQGRLQELASRLEKDLEAWCKGRVVYVHGKLAPSEKSRILADLPAHLAEVQVTVLIFTHAMEVGVDIQPPAGNTSFCFWRLFCNADCKFMRPSSVLQIVRRVRSLGDRRVLLHLEKNTLATSRNPPVLDRTFFHDLYTRVGAIESIPPRQLAYMFLEAENAAEYFASQTAFLHGFARACYREGHIFDMSNSKMERLPLVNAEVTEEDLERERQQREDAIQAVVDACERLAKYYRLGDPWDAARYTGGGTPAVCTAREIVELFHCTVLKWDFVRYWIRPECREIARRARDLRKKFVLEGDDEWSVPYREKLRSVWWLVTVVLGLMHHFDTVTAITPPRQLAALNTLLEEVPDKDRVASLMVSCAGRGLTGAAKSDTRPTAEWKFSDWVKRLFNPILRVWCCHKLITSPRLKRKRGGASDPTATRGCGREKVDDPRVSSDDFLLVPIVCEDKTLRYDFAGDKLPGLVERMEGPFRGAP